MAKILAISGQLLAAKLYVGRPMGVPTYLHWTLFLMFYLMWTYGGALQLIQYGSAFVAVLLHELSHCFFTRRYGLYVQSIMLCPLGGVAAIDLDIPQPLSEFVIAVAGPLASLGLAIITIPFWYFCQGTPRAVFGYFVWINLMIFLFNGFVPAFPMDAGRMLRAFLNWKLRDVLRATEIAVIVGQATSVMMWLVGFFYRMPMLGMLAVAMWWLGLLELASLRARVMDKREELREAARKFEAIYESQ